MKRIAAIAAVFFVLDQATKAVAVRFLSGGPLSVVPGYFDLSLVFNRGAAWGILAGRRLLLAAVSAAMLVLLWANRKALAERPLPRAAAGLLAGGILGNLADRLFRGGVVDFLDFHWRTAWRYPTFNAADVCICAGVGLLLLDSFRCPREKR